MLSLNAFKTIVDVTKYQHEYVTFLSPSTVLNMYNNYLEMKVTRSFGPDLKNECYVSHDRPGTLTFEPSLHIVTSALQS